MIVKDVSSRVQIKWLMADPVEWVENNILKIYL